MSQPSSRPFAPGSWSAVDFAERGLLEPLTRVARNLGHDMEDTFAVRVAGDEGRTSRLARAAVWQWLRDLGWSYPQIATAWGVDHSQVMQAIGPTRASRLADRRARAKALA